MPYVQRDTNGNLVATYAAPQPGIAEEYLPDEAPEVVAFTTAAKHIPNMVLTCDFVARFTNQEYLAVGKQRAADIANNKVGYSKNWDIITTADVVDLNKQKTQTIKDDLVAAGVLTQARADEIFS